MRLSNNYRRAVSRIALGVLPLVGSAGAFAVSKSTVAQAATANPTCSTSQLTVAADSGSGAYSAAGNQGIAFIIINLSHRACSLKGYPRLQLYPSSYKGNSIKVIHGGGGIFVAVAPRSVVIEPGATASFGINWGDAYNQGDPNAGPCETQGAAVSLPEGTHTYSGAFHVAVRINFCYANFGFSMTSIQHGPVPKQT
jgi:Domain of unknown function (DUF4232)